MQLFAQKQDDNCINFRFCAIVASKINQQLQILFYMHYDGYCDFSAI